MLWLAVLAVLPAAVPVVDTATELRIGPDEIVLQPSGSASLDVEIVYYFTAGSSPQPTRVVLRIDEAGGYYAAFSPNEIEFPVLGEIGAPAVARANVTLEIADAVGVRTAPRLTATAEAFPNGNLKGSSGTDSVLVGGRRYGDLEPDRFGATPHPETAQRTPAPVGLAALAAAAFLARRV